MNLSLGADPEFMLTKDGSYVSAIGIVQGDIVSRINIKGHQFYWDNVLAECAIKPGFSKEEVVVNFKECFQEYVNLVRPYKLVVQSAQEYPESELQTDGARTGGCAPDRCVYTLKQKRARRGFMDQPLRTCGGHVHLGQLDGFLPEHCWEMVICVRLLDLFVGIPSLFIDHDPTSARRREMYGQAGRYRPKPYGVEYRSLSNFWLASPVLVELIYDLCKFTIDFVADHKFGNLYAFNEDTYYMTTKLASAFTCLAYNEKQLMKTILSTNKKKARTFVDIANQYLPADLQHRINELTLPKQYDFYQEWGLA